MKKSSVVFITLISLLNLIVSGAILVSLWIPTRLREGEETTAPTEGKTDWSGSGLTCDEVIGNLEELLEPVADMYQMTPGWELDLGEGRTSKHIEITEAIAGKTYDLSIQSTEEGEVYLVSLRADRDKYTELNFALLSCYLYESVGLSEMDAQEFYDNFNMLTEEPEGYIRTDGWSLSATTFDTFLTFGALYSPE